MNWQHKQLASGRWRKLGLVEQLANVGSEVSRSLHWLERGDNYHSQQAFYRALELLDLTRLDPKNLKKY